MSRATSNGYNRFCELLEVNASRLLDLHHFPVSFVLPNVANDGFPLLDHVLKGCFLSGIDINLVGEGPQDFGTSSKEKQLVVVLQIAKSIVLYVS